MPSKGIFGHWYLLVSFGFLTLTEQRGLLMFSHPRCTKSPQAQSNRPRPNDHQMKSLKLWVQITLSSLLSWLSQAFYHGNQVFHLSTCGYVCFCYGFQRSHKHVLNIFHACMHILLTATLEKWAISDVLNVFLIWWAKTSKKHGSNLAMIFPFQAGEIVLQLKCLGYKQKNQSSDPWISCGMPDGSGGNL